jgi:hypothetical protein
MMLPLGGVRRTRRSSCIGYAALNKHVLNLSEFRKQSVLERFIGVSGNRKHEASVTIMKRKQATNSDVSNRSRLQNDSSTLCSIHTKKAARVHTLHHN